MGAWEPPHEQLALINQIQADALLDCGGASTPQDHARLLDRIEKLRLAVETPQETVLRIMYQPPQNAALRVLINMGVVEVIIEHREKGASASDLAERTGAEKELIVRLVRIPVSLGLVNNPAPETYTPNARTHVLCEPTGKDGIRCLYDLTMPTFAKLPEYFERNNYTIPTEYNASPMHWATGQSQFEWLADRPFHQTLFNSYMRVRRAEKRRWFDVWPESRWVDAVANGPGEVFLADVGGNQGHDLVRFREKYNTSCFSKARLVLQDLPAVVEGVQLEDYGVEVMAHDFFDAQPVKNARIYFFRSIFHDWPDNICLKILHLTARAMGRNSRIVIADMVLPDTDAPALQSALDIQMMSIGSGAERSRKQWKELLSEAGLEIAGVWGDGGSENVIEAGFPGGRC